MFLQQLKVDGRGCYSYLIGCPREGRACVVDPERHFDYYPQAAQENRPQVTDVFDTHLHTDHITGSAELAARTGAAVPVHSAVGAGYPHEPIPDLVRDGIDLDKDRHLTTVCRSGYRSNIAGSFLKSLGYTHVFSLIGGMTAWDAAHRTA